MKKEKNYLDYIPVRNDEYKWRVADDGVVEVQVVNKGIFNKAAQLLLKKPKVSRIKLDKYGSIVWKAIDDKKNIGEIAEKVKTYMEDDNEKVFYERLVKFFYILKENKFIKYEEI
ncbi:PqqD family peptide modification chaperone [uncultured Clostridium sp.]|uniref:PqqD family peptide modification chaperone n=1 Tax=uncultured Clostridium sp. TaxID=59620 RepID=UPI0025DA4093|nr:PqqD family peptide modification chaperone [uncultured Clostridium sp.]